LETTSAQSCAFLLPTAQSHLAAGAEKQMMKWINIGNVEKFHYKVQVVKIVDMLITRE
jgi:hypothetical protein